MKIKYAVAASLLLSLSAFAQKEELKGLKKIVEKDAPPTKEDMTKFKELVAAAEPKMGSATAEQQADFYYYKASGGMMEMMTNPMLMANPQVAFKMIETAVDDMNKVIEIEKSGKKNHTKEIQEVIFPEVKTMVGNIAAQLVDGKKYKEAASLYALVYKMDPKDHSQLYNAAAMAVNGQDYDKALEYYLQLDKSGFTGEGTSYVAKNKKSGQVESFPNKDTRDIAIKTGEYSEPKDEKLPSLKGEITKNIALIYVQKGENDKAKAAMAAARKNNPDDVNLIVAEANIYYQAKDMEGYKRLINEAAAKSPNNPELFYNLGVVASETDKAEAKNHYNKALQIDPNYEPALVGMASLILSDEQKIVDEMNGITGTSKKDNDRYDALKKKKDGLYTESLTYLEKAHKLKPDNQYTISLLAGIYQALERDADYKAMKAKMKG
ncbi:tetratricopeptide repeat protein [Flavobacterium sp. MFBS3-15]|uniref:tetratricopeptide repeat protein n=1 Tax=Flavobacterium sp. MFBS3-15 TaxID=2989816 RepID=UPI00223597BE|nr:tetratricopeptide repeat protein [Flavobacterium sp. MFBS3-15]MCW4468813.1 tetratricopeptide repeat protein [Flavobacterium sp. MFBS3-15]